MPHSFPSDLSRRFSVPCANGCGTIARQPRTAQGVGYVEFFVGLEKTGPRATDCEGVWTIAEPPCAPRAA